jgi:hypothetical protein
VGVSKFKRGDRVCCYGQNTEGTFDVLNKEGDKGTVVELDRGRVVVEMDNAYEDGRVCTFLAKQCRRLKPKRKPEVVEFEAKWFEDERKNVIPVNPGGRIAKTLQQFIGKRTKVRVEVLGDE